MKDIGRIEELAVPIIREADDGREANQHVGAFIPKKIEVTNYRSYTHAVFGFEEIRMAMVNGFNGVGKSSLFMDAIADCLYENSRDGAIGEWLRNGEKKGAIIFEFEMGGANYRVARTRNQSGRGTLALARLNPDTGEWENEGDTTMKLTQEKIVKTVGMDCQTFCSIALIRQDAYGLFLEADSDRRMEVLSNLLNLGVYARAEDIAKDKASDQRHRIATLNDRMNILEDQMAAQESIERELKEQIAEKELKVIQIKTLELQIGVAEREEALRQELIRQAGEKAQDAAKLDAQAQEKERELQKQTKERDDASVLAGLAESAAAAADTITRAREELEGLARDEKDYQTLTTRKEALWQSLEKSRQEQARLAAARQTHAATLERREVIEAAAQEMEKVRAKRQALAPRIAEYDNTLQEIGRIRQGISEHIADSRVRIGQLKNKITTAEGKTQLLIASGCPIADTARCAFLKDAQAAKTELADLESQLEVMKEADRKKHEEMTAQMAAAQEKLEGIGTPKAELDALAERERRAASDAAQAGKLEAAVATVAQIGKQEAEKAAAIEDMEKEQQEIDSRLPVLAKSVERAVKLRNEIKTAEPTAALQSRCAAAVATVTALNVTIDIIAKDMAKARQEAAQAHQEADEMKARVPEAVQTGADALRKSRDALAGETERLATRIGGFQTKLDGLKEARKQWEAYREEKNQIARTLTDYNTLAAAFGLDGIQYVIIRSIVPEIQRCANIILSAMTGGRMAVDFKTEKEQKNKKIVNSLDVWINSLSGGSRPYSSHSGGEKVKIALAVTLGLADVKAHRAGVQLGMLFIDEPPFLDGDGTDAYADALVSMANRNPKMRILAISHDPQLKSRFAQNITVTASENGSKVIY